MRSRFAMLIGAAALVLSAGSAAAYEAYTPTPAPLRVSPSVKSALITTILPNTPFNVMGCRRWCQVQYGGGVGYVDASYVVPGDPDDLGPGPQGLLAEPLETYGTVLGADRYGYATPGY
ncbi:SH3 domain-containing protein [Methylocystis sp. 9N]|uniref:SH3 domain-containing protein n=1 Tax=Methylocystis borbori TaxID=3118750 RepID=A0ABU7XLL7_9HYPH